ncbi:MAG: hypothetical protein JXN64_15075 [Spirochaetes bacterium]|nr:hypothetical protein [Spirochaetota bacterium]
MKIKCIIITGSVLCLFMLSSSLNAVGLGIYGTASKADYVWTYHIHESDDPDIDSDVSKFGMGFVLDTCLSMDKLFNYRLNAGYARINVSNKKNWPDMTGNEYHVYNTFGFGVFRSEIVRLWLGPQIGFGFMNGEYDSSTDPADEETGFFTFFYTGALVAGINFNIENLITIGVDGGYRLSKHAGTGDSGSSYGITCTGKEYFANLSVLFRINDVF